MANKPVINGGWMASSNNITGGQTIKNGKKMINIKP